MKTKRFLSVILIVTMVMSMGMAINASAFSTDYTDDAWSYSKTFSSANDTIETLDAEGFQFEYYKPTVDTDHLYQNGTKFYYGKNDTVIDFDYGFETSVYKQLANTPIVGFNYTSSGYYALINDASNYKLIKNVSGTNYILQQFPSQNLYNSYITNTYSVEVRNISSGINIKATVKHTHQADTPVVDGATYTFDYTDTLTDIGADGLDNGDVLADGKLYFNGGYAGTKIYYLDVYEILAGDVWAYEHTFTDADTVDALAEDGYSFSNTPTFNADGMYGNASMTNVTFAPKKSAMTEDYNIKLSIYQSVNPQSYARIILNSSDSGYYYINEAIVSGYVHLELHKVVGGKDYVLAVSENRCGSGVSNTVYNYDITVGISTDNVKITAAVTNKNNINFEYIDTASDVGYDELDNGAPLLSGVLGVNSLPSAYKLQTMSLQSTPGVYEDVIAPEEPSVQSNVLALSNDRDPYTGVLATLDAGSTFTFDTAYSSIGLDLGDKTEINNIVLVDGNNTNRMHRADLSLYVSDDNVNYTRIKDFTATKVGGKVYIYNFTANARYIKVHCHHGVPLQEYMMAESFMNYIDDMMMAQKVTLPGNGGGEFAKVKELSITPNANLTDSVAFVDKALLADVSTTPLRFVLDNGYVLSHYTDAKGTYLRIPEAVNGTEINVNVYGGNAYAAELSDMNSVFEVTYGNKTAYHLSNGDYFRSNITVGQAPNGDVLILANDKADTTLHMARSTDGGRTWSDPVRVTDRKITATNGGGGFLVDHDRGVMFFLGYFGSVNTQYSAGVLTSYDNGNTWTKEPYFVQHDRMRACVYENGIIANSYDGDGPAIDYVFPASSFNGASEGSFSFAAFSRDNGRTWQASPTYVGFWPENWTEAHEAGLSEDTIAYLSNGDMTLIARNQWPEQNHYAQSVSHDDGFTWQEEAWISNIWASNGDPNLMNRYDDIVLLWPGNTNGSATAYIRYPLSIAYSNNDMATWNNKMNVWEGTTYGVYNSEYDRSYATQPGFNPVSYKDSDDMYVYWTHHGAGNGVTGQASIDGVLIEDFEDYLYKSKGAAEDFEADEAKYENWFQVKAKSYANATVSISAEKASTGSRSLKLNAAGSPLIANRSMPQIMNGEISYDIFVSSISAGNGLFMDLKGVFNSNPLDGTIYSLRFDKDGNVYVLDPDGEYSQTGTKVATLDLTKWNNIKIKFDRAADIAELYINDEKIADMIIGTEMPKIDGVCFIQFYTVSGSQPATAYIDNFMAYEGVKLNAVAK